MYQLEQVPPMGLSRQKLLGSWRCRFPGVKLLLKVRASHMVWEERAGVLWHSHMVWRERAGVLRQVLVLPVWDRCQMFPVYEARQLSVDLTRGQTVPWKDHSLSEDGSELLPDLGRYIWLLGKLFIWIIVHFLVYPTVCQAGFKYRFACSWKELHFQLRKVIISWGTGGDGLPVSRAI